MKILVKLGGTLLDNTELRASLAGQIAGLNAKTVVVHGGGKQMTRFLKERGVESQFVNGLRVTSPEVIDAVLKVFAGSVNKSLVASLVSVGARAVGICGVDAALAEARQLKPELGAVGEIVRSNPELLNTLVDAGFLPVVACVAGDRQGNVYNVNADQMAVACAAAYQAAKLLFLTDVDGVRGEAGTILPELTAAEALALIEKGIATGGMEAKLRAACAALDGGVGEVVIAPGAAQSIVARLVAGEAVGTRLIGSRK